MSAKAIKRLVLRTPVLGHPIGTELPEGSDDTDLSAYLKSDTLLWVSNTTAAAAGRV